MRLLFAGTPAAAVPSLHALMNSPHDVIAALTRPDRHVGRRGTLTASPVGQAAAEAGLPVLKPTSIRTPQVAADLAALQIDAVAVAAYGALIPVELLELPALGWINLHFSLLPAWRGAAPVQAALRAGEDVTGACTFQIEQGLDTGPIFGTVTETIRPRDTAGDLLGRLATSGANLLRATFDGIADGSLTAVPQSLDGVSYAPKITPADAHVRFDQPAYQIDRLIRSVTPAPGAWVDSRWGRLGLGPMEIVDDAEHELRPGELHASKKEVLVGTATGPLRLGTLQQPGKRAVDAADWARGARLRADDRLGQSL